jgi:hypothetical protein
VVSIHESWSPAQREVRYVVTLDGPTDVSVPTNRYHPDRRYRVLRVRVRFTWTDGTDKLDTFVMLPCREIRADGTLAHREGRLYPDQLRETPDWLESIVTRAMPRGVPS